jgi:Flp pilus assembly pilin Flp
MRPQSTGISTKPRSFSRPLPRRFAGDERGGASVQAALLFGAVGVAMALLAAPMLQGAVERHASGDAFSLDSTTTGSIGQGNRYVVRRSVLSDTAERICVGANCSKKD